jgi:hypothetical protein
MLLSAGHVVAAILVRAVLSPLCHQLPERSFLLEGSPLAVCARCMGLYGGFALGALAAAGLAWRGRRGGLAPRGPGRAPLLMAALPSAFQLAAELAGLSAGGGTARALTGALLGFAVAFYAAAAVDELPTEFAREFHRPLPDPGRSHAKAR